MIHMSGHAKAILFAIVVVAGLLRFSALEHIPPGIYRDEAIEGIEGLAAVETGHFQLFYQTNYGREGLWTNLVGISVQTFGTTQFALRFFAALFGTLTVLGLGLLGPKLFASERIGLLSAFFVATSFWHLNFSRIAFRAILVPLIMVWSFYFLFKAWGPPHSKRNTVYAIIGGAIFGIGFHTYIAFRFAPFVWIVLFVGMYWEHRRNGELLRPFLNATGWWLAAAFITALPIGLYFLVNPEDLLQRANEVSIFGAQDPLWTFTKGFVETLGMFNIQGDCNWRHNMGCSPQLVFPVGVAFLIGAAIAFRNIFSRSSRLAESLKKPPVASKEVLSRSDSGKGQKIAKQRRRSSPTPRAKIARSTDDSITTDASFAVLSPKLTSWFLIAWVIFLLAPEMLTREGIPHALRAIGVIPAVFLLAAWGADAIYDRVRNRRLLVEVWFAVVLACGVAESYRYFFVGAKTVNTTFAFTKPFVDIGEFLNSFRPSTSKYIFVNVGGDPIPHTNPDGSSRAVPMHAQTAVFVTLKKSSVTFLFPEDVGSYDFPKGSVIAPLLKEPRLFEFLRTRGVQIQEKDFGSFEAGLVQ